MSSSFVYQYETISSFIKDVRLMFSNCRTFWAEDEGGAHYITDANKMEIIFDKNLKVSCLLAFVHT